MKKPPKFIEHPHIPKGQTLWTIGIGLEVGGAPLHLFKMPVYEGFSVESVRRIFEDALVAAQRKLQDKCPICEARNP